MLRLRVNSDRRFEGDTKTIVEDVENVFLLNTHSYKDNEIRFEEDIDTYGNWKGVIIEFFEGKHLDPHYTIGTIFFDVRGDSITDACIEAKDFGKSGSGYDGKDWYFDINLDKKKPLTYQEFMKELANAAKKLDNAVRRFRNRTSSRFSFRNRFSRRF